MGLRDILSGLLDGTTTCGDLETLIQPGGSVNVRCSLPTDHDGNHYDRTSVLEWGNEPLHDFKDRRAHFE